jgi:hypothetical protein
VGALFAAAVLAISPVAITASRTASGEVMVVAVMLGLIVAGEGYLHDGRVRWLYAGATLLGIGLASGRTIYSALLILVISVGLIAIFEADKAREKWQAIRSTPGLPGRLIAVLVAVFLTSATAFAWRTGGLGATIDLLSAWLGDFRAQAGVTGWYWPFQVLAVYEPLVIVAGIVGLFVALQRGRSSPRFSGRRFGVMLIVWLAVAMILVIARSGRTDGDTLLVVIPLALLSGYTFEALADSLRAVRFSVEEGVLMLVLLPVIAYFALGLASYANNPIAVSGSLAGVNLGPAAQLIQSLLAMALAIILVAMFAALGGTEMAVRGTTMAILAALAMTTWGAGWGAAQVRPGDPREIIAGPETTALDVRDLARDLAQISADKTTDTTSLPFVVQSAPNSVLGWYLRSMINTRFVSAVDALSAPSTFITTGKPPTLSSSYAGQRFTLRHEWRIEGESANDVLKWLVYRRAETPTPTQEAVLWVKQGQ